MSVHLGVDPSSLTDNSHYSQGAPPSVSYLYSPNRSSYLFSDSKMDQFSFLPAIKIKNKKVIFTINPKPVVYYDNKFIFSLPDFLKKVTLPKNLNQKLLDKIATIANYLAQGEEYEYIFGTAKQKSVMLSFLVKKGEIFFRATLRSFQEEEDIQYEEIDSSEISKV